MQRPFEEPHTQELCLHVKVLNLKVLHSAFKEKKIRYRTEIVMVVAKSQIC